jgi:RNA polymerase sigma-70 factor (ECF subfamily)
MTPLSDHDLMCRCRQGDTEAFCDLFVRWRPRLGRLLSRWTNRPTEAEDLCQEVFLRVYRAREGYRADGAFSTWLYRIALNVVRDDARRRRVTWQALSTQRPPAAVVEPNQAGRDELQRAVTDALATLADPLREVLLLRQFGELTFAEIADVTGLPASTVKSRVWSALEKLRGELRRRGIDETDLDL